MPCDSVAVRQCRAAANLAELAIGQPAGVQAICALVGQALGVQVIAERQSAGSLVINVGGVRVYILADGRIEARAPGYFADRAAVKRIADAVQAAVGQVGGALLQAKIVGILKRRYAVTSDVQAGAVRVVEMEV